MTRLCRIIIIAVTVIIVLMGCVKAYESQKWVDDLVIKISAGKYPLIKGDNSLLISVADKSGNAVTNAAVDVRYYMPPMAGMAPMEFRAQPVLKENSYVLTANIPMEGGWKLEVSVTRPDRPVVSATFNLDAR